MNYNVTLENDGSLDTVVCVNGYQLRYSQEDAEQWRDEETGAITDEGWEALRELAIEDYIQDHSETGAKGMDINTLHDEILAFENNTSAAQKHIARVLPKVNVIFSRNEHDSDESLILSHNAELYEGNPVAIYHEKTKRVYFITWLAGQFYVHDHISTISTTPYIAIALGVALVRNKVWLMDQIVNGERTHIGAAF